ncbi:AGE family epimerase/isomerase [Chryseobacterium mucoviscidosis]|uniref:Cellobiose 2-epimerase n=1 Tax=Chryseobacterium mucoviscidosis TaxID=1945581 RepID=A0A202CDL8_9FLAO|nr:AGE family epimerase/isomerase [Chryseobacterium mucoviscidosis]OVE61704.1 N-acyl-D-glucosamine 2-epimerase [Chryseobacterium mucoviscidosis]
MQTEFLLNTMQSELHNILNYWRKNTIDEKNGGFIGEIDFNEQKNAAAEKGSVMYGRILWTFSAAFSVTQNPEDLNMAKRAFEEIKTKFYNPEQKGIYWSINADGTVKDSKNQIYAISFVIYGLSEFYKVSNDKEALDLAITLYHSIQNHSFDKVNKGYFEAYTQDWKEIEDMRLSEKDANEKKTMNTHLHIVEAFANLYLVWKDEDLKQNIIQLLETIDQYFINKESWHLRLFFDENWNEKKDVISYGHDIEAAWLLQWCAEAIEDENLIVLYKNHAVKMADATFEGLDEDGGLWYEYEPESDYLISEKHWWPQAELWIGFLNAYQLTQNKKYLDAFRKNVEFTERYIIDKKNGEWIWGINEKYLPIEKDKAGFWKCPYHNGRACLEIIKRVK